MSCHGMPWGSSRKRRNQSSWASPLPEAQVSSADRYSCMACRVVRTAQHGHQRDEQDVHELVAQAAGVSRLIDLLEEDEQASYVVGSRHGVSNRVSGSRAGAPARVDVRASIPLWLADPSSRRRQLALAPGQQRRPRAGPHNPPPSPTSHANPAAA